MATQTLNAKGATVSTPTVSVGGNAKAKTRKYTGRKGHITSRYLRPKISSCHDRCKTGAIDEPAVLKRPGRRLGVRKMWVKKVKVKRIVEPVERKKTTKTKPKPSPDPKIRSRYEPTNRKSTQNELKLPKKNVKSKPDSSSTFNGQKSKKETKNTKNTGIVAKSPRSRKTEPPPKEESIEKNELKQLLAEKLTEMTLEEAENEELESVIPTVETESPLEDEDGMTKTKLNHLIDEKITEKTLHAPTDETIEPHVKDEHDMEKNKLKQLVAEKITEKTLQEAENAELETVESPTEITESTNLPSFESSQSSSDKQVSEEEVKLKRGKVVKVESNDDDPTRRLIMGKGKIPEDNDDGPTRLKFRRGKTLDIDEEDGPTRLNFRSGETLEDDGGDESNGKVNFKKTVVEEVTTVDGKKESETVKLKHQETQEKKEEELLNRVIEETASKLEVDRKNKVEALVGAFETVISLQDDTPTTPTAQ